MASDGSTKPESGKSFDSVVSEAASGIFKTPDGRSIEIRDVWAANLEEEFAKIRELVEKYPYVAMVFLFYLNQFLSIVISFLFRTPNSLVLLLVPLVILAT
jgi:hypothetical protein